ncbi:hypothetical protein DFH27DRAFT_572027 [Peziza echinospora]|nr:hypothetical protein DFH27DRAFT_572027 [Peziza echinospora]
MIYLSYFYSISIYISYNLFLINTKKSLDFLGGGCILFLSFPVYISLFVSSHFSFLFISIYFHFFFIYHHA